MPNYTTIRKKIKEFNVVITNDPIETMDYDNLFAKNRYRIFCKTDKYYATFIMSVELADTPIIGDEFIYNMLQRQFKKLEQGN